MIARMITRQLRKTILERLELFPAVALLGPRQVGKTTLAKERYPISEGVEAINVLELAQMLSEEGERSLVAG